MELKINDQKIKLQISIDELNDHTHTHIQNKRKERYFKEII
jgi:hypothetical protein